MALFVYPNFLRMASDGLTEFEAIHPVGTAAPYSGIYRCESCGREIIASRGESLPEHVQTHHTHGKTRWRLIVCAQTD